MCLEVKSSVAGAFHLSKGEWRTAEHFSKGQRGSEYAVLVVRRSRTGGTPASMDLLPDPVRLVAENRLHREVDTYQLTYRTGEA
jgi:hypothetical protein